MVKHTPTPWKLFDEGDTTAIMAATKKPPKNEVVHWSGFDASHFSGKAAKANAAFIVKAVNNHEALVRALTNLYHTTFVGGLTADNTPAYLAARKALDGVTGLVGGSTNGR